MGGKYNTLKNMGVIGDKPITSVLGKKEPIAHPVNCRTECPYGKGKAFCFPCMKKIMSGNESDISPSKA